MILGIGVDIVHIPRIAALITRRGKDRLAKRILSPVEWNEFESQFLTSSSLLTDQLRQQKELTFLGSRWCIKEAVYKALYPTKKLEWKDVTVSKILDKPSIHIVNGELYGVQKAHVSLSHDGEYTIAQVVLEGKSSSSAGNSG
ncbi:4'-phosphopantetheinyl transferase superfamily [Mycotypha africana]|uniref:4'-phosphopantetheinyl transferase superfamily n=1 Tax=Mycotypha africana TaxID=64632 RepID=UPI0023019495|nr:4'-phosphopantetheinyl transferase superfamily [Mycotypha africana]KAI8972057.1 4'-phosphopantetheinyl transferase superfamily [Mycotypha africana]